MKGGFNILDGPAGTFAYFEPTMGIAITKGGSVTTTETRTYRNADFRNRADYALWGNNNLLPFEIFKEIEESALLDPIINKKTDLLTSGGVMYGHIDISEDGLEKVMKPLILPEIEDFKDMVESDRHIREKTIDYYTLKNTCDELTLDVGRRVTGIYSNDMSEVRLGLQNRTGSRVGMIDKVYISADWRDMYMSENAVIVDAVDPYFDIPAQIRAGRAFKYVIPDRLQNRGRKYYQRGNIENLKETGWLDIAKSIPKWKNAIMEEQISIKYHIEVSQDYWSRKYPKYSQLSESEQKAIERKEIANFLTFFKKKQGGVFLSKFKQVGKDEYSDWKINVLGSDKQFGESAYIEDDVQSGYVIARGMEFPPVLIGVSPGKGGMGAGSGSDIRMSHNAYILGCKGDQRSILRPYSYASALNGWNEKYGGKNKRLHWWFENFFIATLDHGRDTKKSKAES